MCAASSGSVFIVSAASGTGKTTLVSRILQRDGRLRLSVSHTTRAPREGEENGKHYHFVDVERFLTMRDEGAFLEFAEVYGNYYGTSTDAVQQMTAQGYDVILEIDVQGAEQVRRLLPEAIGIFILPPSFEVLAQRLHARATDDDAVIERRLSKAREEIEQAFLFDYVIVNNELEQAEQDLLNVIRACRLTESVQRGFVEQLLAQA